MVYNLHINMLNLTGFQTFAYADHYAHNNFFLSKALLVLLRIPLKDMMKQNLLIDCLVVYLIIIKF